MPYAVQPASTQDAPGLARAMMSAFWTDAHWRILWQPDMTLEDIISDCTERLPRILTRGRELKRHLKVVDTTSGEIVGYSRYILPDDHASTWPEAQAVEPTAEERAAIERKFKSTLTEEGYSRGINASQLEEFGNPLEKVEQELLNNTGPCFAVDYMTVHPEHKGNGAASMMLKEALLQADKAGLKCIVMAHPAGLRLYEKQGFQLVRSLTQDDSKYGGSGSFTQHWLVREPAQSHV